MPDRKEYIEREQISGVLPPTCPYGDEYSSGYNTCLETVEGLIREAPAADVVEVVRCRDCKKRYVPAYCALWYGQINDEHGCRDIFLRAHNDDFYCAYGERKDSADDE